MPGIGSCATGFYYYRRGLEGVAEFSQRILYTKQDVEKDRETVYWTADTLAGLSQVETTLGQIAAHLFDH